MLAADSGKRDGRGMGGTQSGVGDHNLVSGPGTFYTYIEILPNVSRPAKQVCTFVHLWRQTCTYFDGLRISEQLASQ